VERLCWRSILRARIEAIYVKPFSDFWEKFIAHPALLPNADNVITLEPLSAFPQSLFPGNPFIGWGERLMGLDTETMQRYSGEGARVAIIDSGCDNTHPVLTHVTKGLDLTDPTLDNPAQARNWQIDTLSHGTHCAGVITGSGVKGLRGFAPEAEVHILKLFPGGRFDVLIRALKYCIDNKIDVVNCSLGCDQGSELVKLWLDKARQAGVAVVVAAGNSAGPVQFPALLPNVLSVSAIGQAGNFPGDTTTSRQSLPCCPALLVRTEYSRPDSVASAPRSSCVRPASR
jgi:subtilisin